LVDKRNKIMHRHLEDLKREAMKAMEDLGVVLQDLGRLTASDA
jgi:hypothetical protein